MNLSVKQDAELETWDEWVDLVCGEDSTASPAIEECYMYDERVDAWLLYDEADSTRFVNEDDPPTWVEENTETEIYYA